MAKILCIEDSLEFYTYLSSILKEHTLTHATCLHDAIKIVQNGRESFDLILLDVSLPDGNGIKVISSLKNAFPSKVIPVVVLSSDGDVLTKVGAFGMGADDYIQKPPNPDELKARIEARLRGSGLLQKKIDSVSIGNLLIDSDKMQVRIEGSQSGSMLVDLTPIEFKILKLMAGRPGQVFSRDRLIDEVWGISKHITQRTVDAHVSHLRKKISKSNVQVETVLSVGYKIEVIDKS